MRILYLAPHPFYQDRGSPIAAKMLLEILDRQGIEVDLVTYNEGEDLPFENITHYRIPDLPFLQGVRPGFSPKKLVADIFMLFIMLRLLLRNRYNVIHAVEEMAFFALALKPLFGTPYVYDMDSSLAQQMVEQMPRLRALGGVLETFERMAVRGADQVVAVCDALGDVATNHGARDVVLLYDVPLAAPEGGTVTEEDVRVFCQDEGVMAMYVGNLQPYQGIDLLLESVALARPQVSSLDLVIIGGKQADIDAYTQKAADLGIGDAVHFLGPRPIEGLSGYLSQADILVSPRIKGNNTPMKIYSYLDSGRPILATDLWTHTQVLTPNVSVLTEPEPKAYAEGLVRLAQDASLRARLGEAGKALVQEKYSYSVFEATANRLLERLAAPAKADVVMAGEEEQRPV